MATLPIPSSLFAICRVSLGRSRLLAIADGVAAALAAFLLGPAGVDRELGLEHPRQAGPLRPAAV